MTLEQQVQQARSPREALLLIARAVDALRAEPTLDTWDGWVPDEAPAANAETTGKQRERAVGSTLSPPVPRSLSEADLTDDVVIAWIRKHFKQAGGLEPETPEGRVAIAQVREDLLHAPNIEVVEDLFRTTTEGIVESELDWSPLNDTHRAARYDFAKRILNLDVALGDHPEGGDWAADYASGGPMWFYIPNRDLVKQYPESVRSQMVEDVHVTSHARESQTIADKLTNEFGADLLQQPMSTDREGGAPQPMGLREEQLS